MVASTEVSLVLIKLLRFAFVVDRLVMVALDSVALVPIKLIVFVVVELVVEARSVVNCVVPVALIFVKLPV